MGMCQQCGKPLGRFAIRCDECHMKHRAFNRDKKGFKSWKPGSPGRTPNEYRQVIENNHKIELDMLSV